MNLYERLMFAPKGGQFREIELLVAVLPPSNALLYRRLLPPTLTMPGQPAVWLYFMDAIRVAPWYAAPYREWAVLLKAELKGEDGWFALTMPVTRWRAMSGGRYLGFPKYVADEIGFKHEGDAVLGWGRNKGVSQVKMEFHPGLTRALAGWESELLEHRTLGGQRCFQLVPPGKGPRMLKVMFEDRVEPSYTWCQGMVKVQVDASESWGGLIAENAVAPGNVSRFTGGVSIVWEAV